jgi:nucleoside-diphosphate-sugar epimerase
VVALTRNPETAAALRARGIEAVVADIASREWYDRVPLAPDFLLNCVSGGGAGLEGYRHSYLEGMRSMLRWCESHGPVGTFAYTSSTSVYPQDGGVEVTETSATAAAGSTRAGILVETEQALGAAPHAYGRAFVLRLAGIYGPGRNYLVDQVRAGQVSGRGEHHLNLAHRDDIVSAIFACLTAGADIPGQTFNIADDHPTRKAEVTQWLAQRLGLPVPSFTGEPAGGRSSIVPDRRILNTHAKRVLGWSPRYPSFREGYAAMLGSD